MVILLALGALVVVDGQRRCLVLQQQQQVVPVGFKLAMACVLPQTCGAQCWCQKAPSYSQKASMQQQGQLMVLVDLMQGRKQQRVLREGIQGQQVTTAGVALWVWVAVLGACISRSSSSHRWCNGTPIRHQAAAAQGVQVRAAGLSTVPSQQAVTNALHWFGVQMFIASSLEFWMRVAILYVCTRARPP
jgi:hypothetical protein